VSTIDLKLGKHPASPRPKDFAWADFRAEIELPALPSRFGHANLFTDWQMLGNGPDDTVQPGFRGAGNCVWAGADHEHRMINHVVHRRDVPFSGRTAIADYSAATGYVIGDESTDQGTNMHDAASYRQHTGIVDENGERHKIGAYIWLDPKNWEHLLEATYIFGMVGIGFAFVNAAWDQFDNGEPWDIVFEDGGIDGYHYVPVMGSPHTRGNVRESKVGLVTWARRQEMTQRYYEEHNDESLVYITEEELRGTPQHGLHGFDLERLNSYLEKLRS
jgi:hypothetical protein